MQSVTCLLPALCDGAWEIRACPTAEAGAGTLVGLWV